MTASRHPINVAVLDDYQGVAMSIVDWSKVSDRANIAVFNDHLGDQNAVAERLAPFDVVCIMRERTPMPGSLLRRLPNRANPAPYPVTSSASRPLSGWPYSPVASTTTG